MGYLYEKLDGTKKSRLQKRFICEAERDKNGARRFLSRLHGKNQAEQFFFLQDNIENLIFKNDADKCRPFSYYQWSLHSVTLYLCRYLKK